MVWIYALEANPQFGLQAQALLQSLRKGKHRILTSHFLLAELLVAPVRKGDTFLIGSYRRALRAGEVEMIPFTTRAAMAFAKVRAEVKVSPADAIHLAVASTGAADYFVTVDTRLLGLSVSGIGQIVDLRYPFE